MKFRTQLLCWCSAAVLLVAVAMLPVAVKVLSSPTYAQAGSELPLRIDRVTIPAQTESSVAITGYFSRVKIKQQSPTDGTNTATAFRVAGSLNGTANGGLYEYSPAGGEWGYTGAPVSKAVFYVYNESSSSVAFSVTSF